MTTEGSLKRPWRKALSASSSGQVFVIFVVMTFALIVLGPFGTSNLNVFDRIIVWAPFIALCFPAIFFVRLIAFSLRNVFYINGTQLIFLVSILDVIGLTFGSLAVVKWPLIKFEADASFISIVGFWSIVMCTSIFVAYRVWHYAAYEDEELSHKPRFKTNLRTEKLVSDIVCVVSENQYIRIHKSNSDELKRGSLSQFIDETDKSLGMRIHRSAWVAFEHISDLEVGKRSVVIMRNGLEIPVSKKYVKVLELQLALRRAG